MLRDAVLYRLLLMGEIASALPDSLRERYPKVPWRNIRAFRNLAIHRYFGIEWAVVWQIGPGRSACTGAAGHRHHARGVPGAGKELRAGNGARY